MITAFVLMLGLILFILIQQPLAFLVVVGTLDLDLGFFCYLRIGAHHYVVSQEEERKL